MPKYFYTCLGCKTQYSFYHGMNDKESDCPGCKMKDSLKKLPSVFSTKEYDSAPEEVGHTVKKSIEEFKEDLKEQKKDLKREYTGKDE